MICFMDRTFCASENCTCDAYRKMTPELLEQIRLSGMPVAWGYFCHNEPKNEPKKGGQVMLSLEDPNGPLCIALSHLPSAMSDIDGNLYYFEDILVGKPAPVISCFAIASGLSAAPRFCGQTKRIYTVAEHSIRVSELSAGIAMDCGWDEDGVALAAQVGLLHDAAEALIGDVPAPLKRALKRHDTGGYRAVEEAILETVLNFYCPGHDRSDPDLHDLTKTADRVAFLWECRDLRAGHDYEFLPRETLKPVGDREEIVRMFIDKWLSLGIDRI